MSAWQDLKDWLAERIEQAKGVYRMGYEEGQRLADERLRKKQQKQERDENE